MKNAINGSIVFIYNSIKHKGLIGSQLHIYDGIFIARLNTTLNSIPDTINTIQLIVITTTSNLSSRLIP